MISIILSIFLVACISGSFGQQDSGSTGCPQGWMQNRQSCYLTGERFNGQTWYSAAAFCEALGSHLVEINDAQEFNFIQGRIRAVSWVDGPWIGMIRLFGDSRYYFPSTHGQASDSSLNNQISQLASRATNDCGGFDKYGNNFGFWRCRNGGSPICEMEL
ncbi:perlucin-like protein [Paramacrobiotus metropolitanus]|uniref:perlucin-like protein n=1 Tax=Paramacrobiotus metropolitanus TaxID=2943436 RepID=UPI002445CE07|nr:perlucin-like protein [Paramacrobiotus metropolitanus]